MAHIDFPALRGAGKDRVETFDDVASFVARFDAVPALRKSKESGESGSNWNGGESLPRVLTKCQTGDMARVAPSDKLMTALEDKFQFHSTAFRTVDAMCGGVPNVGAYLAGAPMNMRQRRRMEVQETPLTIAVDITSSGGVDSKDLEKRGAALLALVRLLAARRPVVVYFVCAGKPYGGEKSFQSSAVAVRMDTAPLDLARAAHLLSHTGVARMACYDFISAQVDAPRGSISWAFDSVEFYRQNGVAFWQRALGVDDLLFLPPVFHDDASIKTPEIWLAEKLKEYGGSAVE